MRRPYGTIAVAELSRQAGVGRSTFYEHFEDKHAVLRNSLTPVLTPLADLVKPVPSMQSLIGSLTHFKQVQPRVLAMLDSTARTEIERALADLILARLSPSSTENSNAIAPEYLATCIAGAQLSLIRYWLASTPQPLDAHTLALHMLSTTQSLIAPCNPA